MKYLEIDIGGTFTKYAVMDENCEFYNKGKVPTVYDTTENFLKMLEGIFEENKNEVNGIAVSSAGIIDSEEGIMHTGGSLACISKLHIVEELQKRCGVSVTVENDAKCAALAELWRGALKGHKDAVVMILGTAVGGAVIANGKLLKGNHLLAGEFSYLFTDTEDALNSEKVLALQGGVPALIQLVANALHVSKDQLSGEKIFSMAQAGNEKVLECIRKYVRTLAVQILNYQFITDPEKIAIGGGISTQPLLLDMLREKVKRLNQVYPHRLPLPEVTVCHFFNDSNLIGALYVHLMQRDCLKGKNNGAD